MAHLTLLVREHPELGQLRDRPQLDGLQDRCAQTMAVCRTLARLAGDARSDHPGEDLLALAQALTPLGMDRVSAGESERLGEICASRPEWAGLGGSESPSIEQVVLSSLDALEQVLLRGDARAARGEALKLEGHAWFLHPPVEGPIPAEIALTAQLVLAEEGCSRGRCAAGSQDGPVGATSKGCV